MKVSSAPQTKLKQYKPMKVSSAPQTKLNQYKPMKVSSAPHQTKPKLLEQKLMLLCSINS